MPQVYTATINKQVGKKVKLFLTVETQLINVGVIKLVSHHLAAITIFNNLEVSSYKLPFIYKKKNKTFIVFLHFFL